MKEQLFEILHNRKRMPGERFSDIEGKIENFVNQEVERRVEVERIKFLAGWIMRFKLHSDSSSFCNGFRNMEREYDELCSRLAQKTEGGEE